MVYFCYSSCLNVCVAQMIRSGSEDLHIFAHKSQIFFSTFSALLTQFLPKPLIVSGCFVSATPPAVLGQ